jgi:hypothetical protein
MIADHLMEQAEHLVAVDGSGRPRQANLRRAVSSAYYAPFHSLTDAATRQFVGTSADRIRLRRHAARAFQHKVMLDAAKAFAKGALDPRLAPALPSANVTADLQAVAYAFVRAQEERHAADYNLIAPLTRARAQHVVQQVRGAIARLPAATATVEGQYFLLSLLIFDRLRA